MEHIPSRPIDRVIGKLQEVPGSVDSGQGSDHSEHSDLQHEPRSDADSAWQKPTPPEGQSLGTSHKLTPLEKVKAPNNEINGLMDALCHMIDRTPAATPEVLLPRLRRNLAVEMDEDDMDFPEALRLLQAPQSPGPERLPFKNLSNASSPQRHLLLKSLTRERICFKLVTKPCRPGIYRPRWATSTAGASRDSPKTAGATPRDN